MNYSYSEVIEEKPPEGVIRINLDGGVYLIMANHRFGVGEYKSEYVTGEVLSRVSTEKQYVGYKFFCLVPIDRSLQWDSPRIYEPNLYAKFLEATKPDNVFIFYTSLVVFGGRFDEYIHRIDRFLALDYSNAITEKETDYLDKFHDFHFNEDVYLEYNGKYYYSYRSQTP
jgi:hypothetical protein